MSEFKNNKLYSSEYLAEALKERRRKLKRTNQQLLKMLRRYQVT